MWHMTFSETGGYDCMTGAWAIRGPSDEDTDDKVLVDLAAYGQEPCDYGFVSADAECDAAAVVDALNQRDFPEMDAS